MSEMSVARVAFASPFIPPEWIAAHGLRPSRVFPHADAAIEMEGLCPYAGAFAARVARSADAVVFAATCDQMRRAAELGDGDAPRFMFHVPATWQTAAAHRFYRDELHRLGRFLERLGGTAPETDRLAEEMERFADAREKLLALRDRLTSRAHAEAVALFHASGNLPSPPAGGAGPGGVPLLLLGSPLRRDDFALLDVLDRAGARIAIDATESGEREWPRAFDRRRLRTDPFGELADAYFGHIPAVFRRPNSALFDGLAAAARPPIRGIVFVTHPWCDLWRAEAPRLRAAAALPMLALDLGGEGAIEGAWRTRIEAFLEMLR